MPIGEVRTVWQKCSFHFQVFVAMGGNTPEAPPPPQNAKLSVKFDYYAMRFWRKFGIYVRALLYPKLHSWDVDVADGVVRVDEFTPSSLSLGHLCPSLVPLLSISLTGVVHCCCRVRPRRELAMEQARRPAAPPLQAQGGGAPAPTAEPRRQQRHCCRSSLKRGVE